MNSVIKSKIAFINKLIKVGNFKFIWDAFARRISSEELAMGFKKDLSIEHPEPRSLKKISTRVFNSGDESFFTDNSIDPIIFQFQTCYVAITDDNIPCSRIWLIDPSQNKKLSAIWGNNFPQLNNDEVLLENVYTLPKYRGLGIMPSILHQIAERGKLQGAKYAITFGSAHNTNTSRSFHYAGFQPYVLRKVKWFLFRKSINFQEIPDDLTTHYNNITRRMPRS